MDWVTLKDYATLIAAVIAAAAALFNAIVTPRLTRANEHTKWLREQRIQAYTRLIVSSHALSTWHINLDGSRDSLDTEGAAAARRELVQLMVTAIDDAYAIRLLGTEETVGIADLLLQELLKKPVDAQWSSRDAQFYSAALGAFTRQAREELGIGHSLAGRLRRAAQGQR